MINRKERVKELIKEHISTLVAKVEIEGLATVTGIDMSDDYRHADVWISVLGGNEEEAFARINKKIGEFQGVINKKLTLKNVPRLHFKLDHSRDYVERIDDLFDQISHNEDK